MPKKLPDELPEHSPLGGSSAERWLKCQGSNKLISLLQLPESDEEDYRKEGIALHEASAHCLIEEIDSWEILDKEFHGVTIDQEMADAIQLYLDVTAPMMKPGRQWGVEEKFHNVDIHPLFFGVSDFWFVEATLLDVTDAKFGRGIMVDPDDNEQLMYYALDKLRRFPHVTDVRLRIVQPLGFSSEGPIREWTTTAEHINKWADEVLIPGMNVADMGGELLPGQWCRFCPAKIMCPALHGLWEAAATCDPESIPDFSDEMLGLNYQMIDPVKMFLKAITDETYSRLLEGKEVSGTKLVTKRANRVWKPEAEAVLIENLGSGQVFDTPKFKSPAAIDKIGPAGKRLSAEYAYTPETGTTVALDSDKRMAVKIKSAGETFAHVTKAEPKG